MKTAGGIKKKTPFHQVRRKRTLSWAANADVYEVQRSERSREKQKRMPTHDNIMWVTAMAADYRDVIVVAGARVTP